jgi:hypothetical protein
VIWVGRRLLLLRAVRVSDLVTYQALNYEYILSQKMAIGLDGNVVLKNAKSLLVS